MKNLLLFVLLFPVLSQAAVCSLEFKKKIVVPGKELYPRTLFKLPNDSVGYFRQQNKDLVIVSPIEKIYYYPLSRYNFNIDPFVSPKGEVLFSDHNGDVFEFDEFFNIKLLLSTGIQKLFFWATDLATGLITSGNGQIYLSQNKSLNLIYDLNAGVTNEDDKDSFFYPAIRYNEQYLIVNPAFSRAFMIDNSGKMVYKFDVAQNSFQSGTLLKDGRVAFFGFWGKDSQINIVNPMNQFSTQLITFGKDRRVDYFQELPNGNLVAGVVFLNVRTNKYDQELYLLNPAGVVLKKLINRQVGFNVAWNIAAFKDNSFINVVKDQVQYVSATGKLINSYQLDFNETEHPGELYQYVKSAPVLLSDETVVVQGSDSELYYYQKNCH